MKIVLLLLTVCRCVNGLTVHGRPGQNITLSCLYDITYYGALPACWRRGDLQSTGFCGSNPLLITDGKEVKEETRTSIRYQLLGQLDQGDVSMTIVNMTEGDVGRYGCRVDIPGWFNDNKHHFDLIIAADTTTTTTTTTPTETHTEPTANQSAGHVTSRGSFLTSTSGGGGSGSGSSVQEGGGVTVVLVCVALALVVLVTACGLIIIVRRWQPLHKLRQQQVVSSIHFSSTSSSLQLHSRGSTVENIYQIDSGEDGEYDYIR